MEEKFASAQPELPDSSLIIRSIISSNEELIQQQKLTIQSLQEINHEQEIKLKVVS